MNPERAYIILNREGIASTTQFSNLLNIGLSIVLFLLWKIS